MVHDHRLHSARGGLARRAAHGAFGPPTSSWPTVGSSHARCGPTPDARTSRCCRCHVPRYHGPGSIGSRPPTATTATAIGFGVLPRAATRASTSWPTSPRPGVDGWRFAMAGTGAPVGLPGVDAVPGYLSTAGPRGDGRQRARPRAAVPLRDPVGRGACSRSSSVSSRWHRRSAGSPSRSTDGVDGVLLPSDAASSALARRARHACRADHDALAEGARRRAGHRRRRVPGGVDALV